MNLDYKRLVYGRGYNSACCGIDEELSHVSDTNMAQITEIQINGFRYGTRTFLLSNLRFPDIRRGII